MSAPRRRLPLAPAQPDRRPVARSVDAGARLAIGRVVIAVTGDDAQVLAFVRALHARAQDGCVVIGSDSFVGGEPSEALRERLQAMPRHGWVVAAGEAAALRIAPTFSIGLGARHRAASETTDLWLGQSSEVVADALVEALRGAV